MKTRGHFAIKFTAAVMRVAALLIVIGGLFGALAVTQFQTPSGTIQGVPVAAAAVGYVAVLVLTLVYAIMLWGFADALVLIADTNDAQRVTQAQVNQLMAERGEPRASLMAPVRSDETERLPPPDR